MADRESRRVNFTTVMRLMDRYGPMLEWLERETDGFGHYEIVCHGRRPQKIRVAGEWHILPMVEYTIDAEK